jgi:hypothetical protein
MKNTFWLSLTLVCFLCAGIALAQEVKGPRIEIKEIQHDFGKVPQGTVANHVFEFRNTGDEPLIIERVQST